MRVAGASEDYSIALFGWNFFNLLTPYGLLLRAWTLLVMCYSMARRLSGLACSDTLERNAGHSLFLTAMFLEGGG